MAAHVSAASRRAPTRRADGEVGAVRGQVEGDRATQAPGAADHEASRALEPHAVRPRRLPHTRLTAPSVGRLRFRSMINMPQTTRRADAAARPRGDT